MRFLLLALTLALATTYIFAAERIELPVPQKSGGPDILAALEKRESGSQSAFPLGGLDDQDLSTLLWAATGLNRGETKWTIPTGMGRPPYCKVYITDSRGVFRYDWRENALIQVSGERINSSIPLQKFAKDAPVNMYFVTDGPALSNEAFGEEWGVLLAGGMSQNVYLASQALNIGARLVYSINRELAQRHFDLSAGDKVLFGIVLGKY